MQLRKGEKGFTTAVRKLREYERSAKEYEEKYREWKAQPADAPGRRDYMSPPQFHLSVERYFGRTIADLVKDEDFVLFRCDDCGGLGILASDDYEASKKAEQEADPTGTDLSHRHDWGRRGNLYPDGSEVFMLAHNGNAEETRYIGDGDEYETTIDPRTSIDICLWCEESQSEHSTTVLGIDAGGLAFGVAVGDKTMTVTSGDNRSLKVRGEQLDPWDVARSIGRLIGWQPLGAWRGV
ncbi:MAG: hypothetical protein KGI98_09520, partial [Euryarchaeota archaeon]|nr:hypothetical protein [Euryarchaeota archaeon]